jgi:hypothetical protein
MVFFLDGKYSETMKSLREATVTMQQRKLHGQAGRREKLTPTVPAGVRRRTEEIRPAPKDRTFQPKREPTSKTELWF